MSIEYSLVPRVNPQNRAEAAKFYATAKHKETVTQRQLAEELARESSLSIGDIYSVIVLMSELIGRELEQGNMVDLGELGRFAISIRSSGAETAETYNTSLVKRVAPQFKPSKRLKDRLNNAQLIRAKE